VKNVNVVDEALFNGERLDYVIITIEDSRERNVADLTLKCEGKE
jgi:hypothetical protein